MIIHKILIKAVNHAMINASTALILNTIAHLVMVSTGNNRIAIVHKAIFKIKQIKIALHAVLNA